MHYLDGAWTASTEVIPAQVWSVAMVSAREGWTGSATGNIVEYNGTTWQELQNPPAPGQEILSLARVPGTGAADEIWGAGDAGWAVGDGGVIQQYAP